MNVACILILCRRVSSESEEEEDPYSWARKRRQIKDQIQASSSLLAKTSVPGHAHATPTSSTHHAPSTTASHAPSPTTSHSFPATHHAPTTTSTSHTPSPTTNDHTPSITPINHTHSTTAHHTPSSHAPSLVTNHTPFSTSPPSHNLHQVHRVPAHHKRTLEEQKSGSTKEQTQATTTEHGKSVCKASKSTGDAMEKKGSNHKMTSIKQKSGSAEERTQTSTTEHGKSTCKVSKDTGDATEGEASVDIDKDGTNTKSAKEQQNMPSNVAAAESGHVTMRQRSSDSLTLSSSHSEGEVSSEGTSQSSGSGNSRERESGGKGAGGGGMGGGAKKKSGGKQGKKSKKGKKQKEDPTVTRERSERSQRRRAHVLQRIRQDSLNTSSDEENSLTSVLDLPSLDPTLDPSHHQATGLPTPGSDSPSTRESSEGVRDVQKVKAELRRRILSKKPPAHFETPATDPVFHDVRVHHWS